MKRKFDRVRSRERGFTLPEVLVVIAIIGILAAIAIPTWQSVIRDRQLDSAANQLASDLRLANNRATNQLTNYIVVLPVNSATYQIGPFGRPLDSRSLPDGTRTRNPTPVTMTFGSDGTAASAPSGIPITLRSSADSSKTRTIDLNTETARVKVDS